ncbi:4'-phosphopantetheinyl transferase family protein [Microvirga antarctica]|uniref:4'-phosphopantetheinyl transferase family protein n=1 Tax=Microvirga antarctica TaxID=2819233 RepID=UPI001B30E4DA|nr:hypothetical protein [Microvirga antarctica]
MISVFSFDRGHASARLEAACLEAFDASAQTWERDAAARFRRTEAGAAYRFGHGALRLALREATRTSPTLSLDSTGKPFCVDGPAFNMSHAGPLTVIAVSARAHVGIDVAILESDDQASPLSIAVTDEEMPLLPHLAHDPREAEIVLWSLKEAALKLTGEVMISPQDIAVYRKGDVFAVRASRSGRGPFPHVCVRLKPWLNHSVVALAAYEAVPDFNVTEWQDQTFCNDEMLSAFARTLD